MMQPPTTLLTIASADGRGIKSQSDSRLQDKGKGILTMRNVFNTRNKRILASRSALFSCLAMIMIPLALPAGQEKPLTTEQIIKMSKAGLPADVIVAKIKAEPTLPKISTDDLILLKSAGVNDTVLRALTGAPAAIESSAPAEGAAEDASRAATNRMSYSDPNDPNAPHDPGVYLLAVDRDGKPKMQFIDQVGAGREKNRGKFFARMAAELPGPRAVVRSADAKPVFYMYFSPAANISDTGAILSPSQFSLVSLDQKKDHREATVAKAGWGGVASGIDEKKQALFESQRIRPQVYKVTPKNSLESGEYAFIATTSIAGSAKGATVVIYDFGVDAQ